MSREDRGRRLAELHREGTFLLGNAWDAGTARILQSAGFPAIGTTSSGFAFSLARRDYVGALMRDEVARHVEQLVAAIDVPLSVDAEDGYGERPENVAETIRVLALAGASGASIEDHPRLRRAALYPLGEAVERVQAACEAAASLGSPFTVVARAESFLVGAKDPLADSIERLNRYREAGAHCLYAPGPTDLGIIETLLREVPGPHNVLSRGGMTVAQLEELGVRRISIGGSLARAAFGTVVRAAREMIEQGTFEFQKLGVPPSDLEDRFESN